MPLLSIGLSAVITHSAIHSAFCPQLSFTLAMDMRLCCFPIMLSLGPSAPNSHTHTLTLCPRSVPAVPVKSPGWKQVLGLCRPKQTTHGSTRCFLTLPKNT
ncbi:hypothetical protein QQF64_012402 [Cirrhinus molitorella]|uniref:Secreted protein n=1 Tax=Cirrhinus molitorella TaxID=172907 RepID=A0ABR3LZ23_9TELE